MTERDNAITSGSERRLLEMRREERAVVFLSHVSTMVPVWALVANGLLHFYYREISRAICFQARQGIHLQVMFLLLSVPISLALPLKKLLLLANVPNKFADYIPTGAWYLLLIVYGIYVLLCLIGAILAVRGKIFCYPLVGRTLFHNYIGRGNR